MKIRLYIKDTLANGEVVALEDTQTHYLTNVLRLKEDTVVYVFNGIDGEWEALASFPAKHKSFVRVLKKVKEAEKPANVWLMFAPVKKDCIDFITEKAAELGAAVIFPVITSRTETSRVNVARMQANAIEASEQCRRVSIPEVCEPETLKHVLANWNPERVLFFLDETGGGAPIAATLAQAKKQGKPVAFMVGPEGGFTSQELEAMKATTGAIGVSFDEHILRTETACLSALTLWKYL